MRYLILFAFCTVFFLSCSTAKNSFATPGDAVAGTTAGPVRGFSAEGIYVFKGIPYAQAERFMAPRPPAAWKELRSTVSYGPVCPQNTPKVINESEFFFHHDFGFPSENCLSLNIWTPGIQDHRKRPVMVWLHGGGFATGSGNELPSYDGENLSRKGDVVVVNLNHRLNVLGFLDLSAFGEKYKYSGNMGMLDIVAALQWVQANIRSFGGDPDNVTIFGQSGGGRKVSALLSMPGAKGLFHKAIIQSGAGLSFYNKEESQRIGKLVAARLGLTESTIDAIQDMPYERLRVAGEEALKQLNEEYRQQGRTLDGFNVRWSPVIDNDIIPYQPGDPRSNEFSKGIPIIIGSNKHEFITAFDKTGPFHQPNEQEAMAQLAIRYPGVAEAYVTAVKQAYPDTRRPLDLLEIDSRTRAASLQLADVKSAVSTVYNYLFTWESPVLDGRFRSAHCLELPFVFNNVEKCREMTGLTKEAVQLGDRMSQAWINFARTGNPQYNRLPAWEAYLPANGNTLLFNATPRLVQHHDKKLLELAAAKN